MSDEEAQSPTKGTAEPMAGGEDEHVASLYVPDPQFPHGWYRYWVKRQVPPGAQRPVGFRPWTREG